MFIFLSFNCLPSLTEYLHQESVLALETVPVLVTDCRCNCKRWKFLLQYEGKKNMLPLENSSTTYQTRCKAGHVWCQKKLGQRLEGLGQGEHSVTLTYVRCKSLGADYIIDSQSPWGIWWGKCIHCSGIDNCHWPFIIFLLVKGTSDYRSWDLMRVNCLSLALVLAKL